MWPNFTNRKPVISAPLSGISDSPARRLAREYGADITVSGLISCEGAIRDCPRTWELARFDNSERPIGLQIFGARPENMARAAEALSRLRPDFIDINFGCPAPKVVGNNGGSSILRDIDLLGKIVRGVVRAVDLPVTVKIRSGWDTKELVYLAVGQEIEQAGAAAITLHPRTKIQGYSGRADWSMIGALKKHISIPVIGNGDITGPEDAKRMIEETGCDGIMIGRASMGNPWIFGRVKHYLATGEILPEPSCRERIDLALRHLDLMIEFFGLPRAVFKMRSQYFWYLKSVPKSKELKIALNRLLSPQEVRALLLSRRDDPESETLDIQAC